MDRVERIAESKHRGCSWRLAAGAAARRRVPGFRRALSLALLAGLGLACALGSRDPYAHFADRTAAAGPRHFVVLPVNLTIKTPPEFEPVLDDLFGAVAGYIRDGGDSLETMSREKSTAQWTASIREVRASKALEDNFETAMRIYVASLAEKHSFDAVIAPSIVYRSTKVRERAVKWDDVFRKIKIVNMSDEARKKGMANALPANVSGVSLHVMVFDPSGELIFQKYGGLDLAHDVDMTGAEFTMNPRFSLKQDLLKDSEHLREGIGIAFEPYLPRH